MDSGNNLSEVGITQASSSVAIKGLLHPARADRTIARLNRPTIDVFHPRARG
jgi:hypothetical protein